MRHPAADRADLRDLPRHPLQRPLLGHRHDADARRRARRRRPRLPLHAASWPRAAVVINEARRRGRVTGTDLLAGLAGAAPIDLFGMDAAGVRERTDGAAVHAFDDVPQARLHDEMARRRVYLHPIRWTSLGLSLIEAMHLGMPVVALATTEAPDAVPAGAGVVSTRVDVLADGGPGLRRRARPRARGRARGPRRGARALRAGALPGRLGRPAGGGGEPMRIAMVSEHASPLAVLGGVDAGGQNVHVAALAGPWPVAAPRSSSTPVATTRRCPSASRWRPASPCTTSTPGRRAAIPKDELLAAHGRVRARAARGLARAARPTSSTPTSGCRGSRRWPPPGGSASRWSRPSTRWASSSAATRATRTRARPSAWRSSGASSAEPTTSSPRAPTRSSS